MEALAHMITLTIRVFLTFQGFLVYPKVPKKEKRMPFFARIGISQKTL
jgi:hypothetical protein